MNESDVCCRHVSQSDMGSGYSRSRQTRRTKQRSCFCQTEQTALITRNGKSPLYESVPAFLKGMNCVDLPGRRERRKKTGVFSSEQVTRNNLMRQAPSFRKA